MTLFEIEILSHHYVSPEPFVRHFAQGYRSTVQKLIAMDLLKPSGIHVKTGIEVFATTERGEVYVRAIQEVPLPVHRWEIPGFRAMLEEN